MLARSAFVNFNKTLLVKVNKSRAELCLEPIAGSRMG